MNTKAIKQKLDELVEAKQKQKVLEEEAKKKYEQDLAKELRARKDLIADLIDLANYAEKRGFKVADNYQSGPVGCIGLVNFGFCRNKEGVMGIGYAAYRSHEYFYVTKSGEIAKGSSFDRLRKLEKWDESVFLNSLEWFAKRFESYMSDTKSLKSLLELK